MISQFWFCFYFSFQSTVNTFYSNFSLIIGDEEKKKKNSGWKLPKKDQTHVKVGKHHIHTIVELKL